MARRRRKSGRGSSYNKESNQIWTVIQIDAGLVAATPWNIFNVVQDSDWSVTGGGRKGTLKAIRGWLAVSQVGTAGSDFQGYFTHKDEDVVSGASLDPFVSGTYVDEDILFTLGGSFPGSAVDQAGIRNYEINVKSKRKIKSGTTVSLVMAATALTQIHVVGILRGLIQLN